MMMVMLAVGEDPRLVTTLRTGEEGHVTHHAEHGDVHALEHAEAADGVAQGDVLRRGHDDGPVQDDLLADGQLDVAGARGQVEEEHVQGPPRHGVQELVHRFWRGTVAGCYVGHGETYLHPDDVLWWFKGGVLHGESAARIAFLRRILESAPAGGLEPEVPETQANFLWLPLRERSQAFTDHALDHKVVVRGFSPDGVRISAGASDENDLLIDAASSFPG